MKDKIKVFTFLGVLFVGALAYTLVPDRDVSNFERRRLMGVSSLKEDFAGNIEDYMNDQFPLRDFWIGVSSYWERNVLANSSANDVYVEDGYSIEENYPLDEKSLNNFVQKISSIQDKHLKESRTFLTIIPDKSYFLHNGLKLDFNYIKRFIKDNVDSEYIDAFDVFNLEDYYRTDIHIKQPSYGRFVRLLSEYMSFEMESRDYKINTYDKFYGATYSKVPFLAADSIEYLTDKYTDSANVRHLEYGERQVYDLDRLGGVDSYDVFLGGASAIVEIENTLRDDGRELVIFRDSFASSLTPWLIPYYKKITLVDLRYINMDLVPEYVDFEDKDVLFMYSTLVINSSHLLKVNN